MILKVDHVPMVTRIYSHIHNGCIPMQTKSASSIMRKSSSSVQSFRSISLLRPRLPQQAIKYTSVSRIFSTISTKYIAQKGTDITTSRIMTNKSRLNIQQNINQSFNYEKSHHLHTNGITKGSPEPKLYSIPNKPHFQNMASIQKLAIEPTREHIENIRHVLKNFNAKDNQDQQITLQKDHDSGIGVVCIKSAAKNGISAKMMCDFLDIIDDLYSWPQGKGVVIYGHNGFFCSGGDLVSVRELANYEDGLRMATLMQYNLARLQALPMITMALIQGKALGGGAEIAISTDLRAITKSSKFGYVHCRVGIVAAWGGGSRLVQLVGPSRAIELMSSGRLVDANEAFNLGLVNKIIDDTESSDKQILQQACEYLKLHLVGANSTIMAIKGIVNAARTLPLEQALAAECQILSSIWGKPPHMEALNNNVKHRGD